MIYELERQERIFYNTRRIANNLFMTSIKNNNTNILNNNDIDDSINNLISSNTKLDKYIISFIKSNKDQEFWNANLELKYSPIYSWLLKNNDIDLVEHVIELSNNNHLYYNKLLKEAIDANNEQYNGLIKFLADKTNIKKQSDNFKFENRYRQELTEWFFVIIGSVLLFTDIILGGTLTDYSAYIGNASAYTTSLSITLAIAAVCIALIVIGTIMYYSNQYDNAYDYAKAEGKDKAASIIRNCFIKRYVDNLCDINTPRLKELLEDRKEDAKNEIDCDLSIQDILDSFMGEDIKRPVQASSPPSYYDGAQVPVAEVVRLYPSL